MKTARTVTALGALFTLSCSSQAPVDEAQAGGSSAIAGSSNAAGGSGGSSSGSGGSAGAGGSLSASGGSAGSAGSASGGVSSNAGSAGSGGSTGGSHNVGNCDSLAAVGTWEDMTPPEVKAKFPDASCEFGVQALSLDPSNSGTLYLGTCSMGLWKTTDCAATWTHVNTGTNGDAIETGMQWSVTVDPVNPDLIYANAGYSSVVSGAWKSTNAGVDWESFWPPADDALKDIVDYNFVHKIRIDPNDHEHVLVSFHANCKAPYNAACIAETTDAGVSWKLVSGKAEWSGGEDQTVWFLESSAAWLYASQTNGMWRTSDSGTSWSLIGANYGAHNGGQLYRADNGSFYLSCPSGVLRSPDGVTWSIADGTGSGMIGVTGDGTKMYASRGPYVSDTPYQPYFSAPESDGTSWTAFASPDLGTGGYELAYDRDHHLLYSSNFTAGFWRLVTE